MPGSSRREWRCNVKWQYWITLYIQTHCTARGLRPTTMAAYQATLNQFREFLVSRLDKHDPEEVAAPDVMRYLQFLRNERDNGNAALNRQLVVLKNFYRAVIAMGHLQPSDNPLACFPKIKAAPKKLPVTLSEEEIERLLDVPPTDTVLGLRDRAILALLYGTGIRASECAGLQEEDVDLEQRTILVTGKGGHERTLPLNDRVYGALLNYRTVRGHVPREGAFFQSRRRKGLSRAAIYERVRTWARVAKICKTVSPHRIRHTFATHLVRAGVNLVTIRDLLGHRLITSTQIYLHVSAEDLREAADRHPIGRLGPIVEQLLPNVRIPKQHPPWRRRTG